MAVGDPVVARPTIESKIVRPTQISNPWKTIIRAGGINVQDAATITDPTAEITNSTTSIFKVMNHGTTFRLRMKYDDGDDGSGTDPVIKVFGRYDSNEQWETLPGKSGSITTTLVIAQATDVSDGTFNWTEVDPDDDAWDLNGCGEVLVGVQTAFVAGTGGSSTTATVEAKVI